MCFRTNYTFGCDHTENDILTNCRSPQSSIVPRRCLSNLKPAETRARDGDCTVCMIQGINETRMVEEKRIQEQFEQAAQAAKLRRSGADEGDEDMASVREEALKYGGEDVKGELDAVDGIPVVDVD